MKLYECMLYKNKCYLAGQYIKPTRILVHSTGANNTTLKRYVQPHSTQTTGMGGKTREEMMELLGKNRYGNHWNGDWRNACVNAFIGTLADGSIATVQTLPWNMKPWGCGSGSKGSFNNVAIQFEICEDDRSDFEYCKATYNEAVELCAMLCKQYDISPDMIVNHKEGHKMGYANNHGDTDSWWKHHGFTMDGFRADVKKALGQVVVEPEVEKEEPKKEVGQTVKIELDILRKGAVSAQVKTLQRLLIALGYKMKNGLRTYGVDGSFGTATENAVKAFQKAEGLDDDGICGPQTWNALLK